MTVQDVLEQAKTLTPEERRELMERLQELEVATDAGQSDEHWGQALNRLLDESDPIEMKYPDIEDPVEWLKQVRDKQNRQRLGDE